MLQISDNQIEKVSGIIAAILYEKESIDCRLVDSSVNKSGYSGNSLYLYFLGNGSYYEYDDELSEGIMESNRLSEVEGVLSPYEVDDVVFSFHYEDWDETFGGDIVYFYYFSVTIYLK